MGLHRKQYRNRAGELVYTRTWYGSYFDRRVGHTVEKSTRLTDKTAALAVLRDWERTSADPTHRPADSTTLRAAIATLKKLKKQQGKAEGTLTMIDQKTAHLARILGDETIVRDLTARNVDEFISQRRDEGAKDSTIYKEVSCLSALLKLAARHGYCAHPATILPETGALSGESEAKERHLSDNGEALAFLSAFPEQGRRAHIAFVVGAGARWSESKRALRDDVDFEAGHVFLRGSKTKKARLGRYVPITHLNAPLLRLALSDAPGEGLLFRPWSNVRREMHAACRRARVAPLSPNDLRRTYGKWHRKAGATVDVIAESMGHVDGRMVAKHYGKLSGKELGDAMRRSVRSDLHEASGEPTDSDEEAGTNEKEKR